MIPRPPRSTLFPYTSSSDLKSFWESTAGSSPRSRRNTSASPPATPSFSFSKSKKAPRSRSAKSNSRETMPLADRKSTRLNSSHEWISYAVFCLKKKKKKIIIKLTHVEKMKEVDSHNGPMVRKEHTNITVTMTHDRGQQQEVKNYDVQIP